MPYLSHVLGHSYLPCPKLWTIPLYYASICLKHWMSCKQSTLIRCRDLCRLICVYTVCSGLSTPIYIWYPTEFTKPIRHYLPDTSLSIKIFIKSYSVGETHKYEWTGTSLNFLNVQTNCRNERSQSTSVFMEQPSSLRFLYKFYSPAPWRPCF